MVGARRHRRVGHAAADRFLSRQAIFRRELGLDLGCYQALRPRLLEQLVCYGLLCNVPTAWGR